MIHNCYVAGETVDEQWNTLDSDFVALIKGYVAGLNAYANAHPGGKIQNRLSFKDEKEYLTAEVFHQPFCDVDDVIPQILGGKWQPCQAFKLPVLIPLR